MRLGGQSSGSIGQHHVDITRLRRLYRIVDDCGGVAALLCNHCYMVALAPGHQLFASCGTKGVASGEHYRQTPVLQIFRQLADRSGLARPVYAYQQNNVGARRAAPIQAVHFQRLLQWLEQFEQTLRERCLELSGLAQTLLLDLMAQIGEQCIGRVQADISRDEYGFQIIVKVIVYPATATEQAGQLPASARQSGF